MAVTEKRKLGNIGENLIVEYLLTNKYNILRKNYTKKCGEIDVIAQKNGIITFIEVKTRKFGSMVSPLESVTRSKQLKIIKTAEYFLLENPQYQNLQPRFDIGAVVNNNGVFTVDYYENAFY